MLVPEVVPVPDSNTVVTVLFETLCFHRYPEVQVRERFPLTVALDSGAKVAPIVMLCPGARITGMAIGLVRTNHDPVTVAWDKDNFDPPELATTTDFLARLPDGTLPKFSVVGLTLSCPAAASAYRRTFSRIRPHPTTLHCKPGRFITLPSCAVTFLRFRGHGRGMWSTARLNRPGARTVLTLSH
jgi:hypothetical protein